MRTKLGCAQNYDIYGKNIGTLFKSYQRRLFLKAQVVFSESTLN